MSAAALVLLVALAACAKPQEPAPPWKVIDAPTLRAMMASDKGLPVFNTMSEIECLDHRIPGSKCLACEEIENNLPVLPADKDQDIVFYCESAGCYRSCRAAGAAVKAGYKQVHVLRQGNARLEAGRVCHGDDRADPAGIHPVGPGHGAQADDRGAQRHSPRRCPLGEVLQGRTHRRGM